MSIDTSVLSEPSDKDESWFLSRWRPAFAWMYLTVCVCDFIAFPVLTTVYYGPGQHFEWHPLTLQGGGLFHMSMGAIIGIATWNRTQEKLAVFNSPQGGGSMSSVVVDSGADPAPRGHSGRAD